MTTDINFKPVRITKTDANSMVEILYTIFGRNGHEASYHYDIAIEAIKSFGRPVAFDSSIAAQHGITAMEYLDEVTCLYRIHRGTITVYAKKELI